MLEWNTGTLHISEELSAGVVFKSKDSRHDDDYHKNFTCKTFMEYMEKDFLPTHRKKYGRREAIIIMDNAPYHHCRQDGFNVRHKNFEKYKLVELAKKLEIPSITVKVLEKGKLVARTWERKDFGKVGRRSNPDRGPTRQELQLGMIEWLAAHDEHSSYLRTDLQNFAKKENLRIIFTPPNRPEYQPIEMYWALTKACLRNCYYAGRTQDELLKQVPVAWYGGKAATGSGKSTCECKGISKEVIQKLIRKSHKKVNEHLRKKKLAHDVYTFYQPEKDMKEAIETFIYDPDEIMGPAEMRGETDRLGIPVEETNQVDPPLRDEKGRFICKVKPDAPEQN